MTDTQVIKLVLAITASAGAVCISLDHFPMGIGLAAAGCGIAFLIP